MKLKERILKAVEMTLAPYVKLACCLLVLPVLLLEATCMLLSDLTDCWDK